MKTLYALFGSLIVVLVLAAFNPDRVVDAYEVAKIRLVEMPRAIEDLNQKKDAAENGNMYALYDIAGYHMSSSAWHIPEYFPDVLGPKDPEKGVSLMREAAEAGHADALYMLSRYDGHDELLFIRALEAGSIYAIGKAWANLMDDICGEDAYAKMMLVAEHAGDPAYPWGGTSPWLIKSDEETVNQQRRAWWSDITSNISQLDELRADTCMLN